MAAKQTRFFRDSISHLTTVATLSVLVWLWLTLLLVLPLGARAGGVVTDCTEAALRAAMAGLSANNGGPTLTMALLADSPAINAGDTAAAPPTDQRGFPRPAGLAADIGAFEYASVMPTLAVSLPGANGLRILGSGNPGQSCRLLSSLDLSNWVPIATNQFGSDGTILFNVSCAPAGACGFYRLVMP